MNKILVVEDEKTISELIRINLVDSGYECQCVYDGKQAADLIENKNFDFSACSILQFLFYLRQQLYRQLIQYGFPNAQCRESKPQFIRFGITQTVFVRTERNKIDEYYRC